MTMNRKIINATVSNYNGIEFKSALEVMTYRTLIEEGMNPEYEKHTYILMEGFVPKIPFYTKNTLKRKDYRCKVVEKFAMVNNKPLQSITYTPDFYFEYGDKKIIVETKGFPNEVWPYKFKMFRKLLETFENSNDYMIWEIHSKKQLLECIKVLKTSVFP